MKKNPIDMVREFHEYSGHPVGEKIDLITRNRADERHAYISEELQEFYEGIVDEDINDAVDAMADACYFIYGTLVEMGVSYECFTEFFNGVHRANMTKFCTSEEDAKISVHLYSLGTHPQAMGRDIEATYRKQGELYIIYNAQNGKILKSYKTEKPDTLPILQKYSVS